MSFGRLRFGKLEELRAAFECKSDSEFAKTPAFSTAEALTQHLQRISFQHGFSVVKKNTHQTKIVYVCKFAGHYKDHDPKRTAAAALKATRVGTDADSSSSTPPPSSVLSQAAKDGQPRRVKQRRSQKCGCTWTATAKVIDGMWNLTRLHDHHRGHQLVPGLLLPEHRRLSRAAMEDLVAWRLSGVPTALIIERIRDKYKVTLSSVDVHNKLRGKLDKVKQKPMLKQEQEPAGLSPTPSTSIASPPSRELSTEVTESRLVAEPSNDSIPSSPETLASQRRQAGSPIRPQKHWAAENTINSTQQPPLRGMPLLPPPDSMLFSVPSVHRPPLSDISNTNTLKTPLAERRSTHQQYHRLVCTPAPTPNNNTNNTANPSFPTSSPFSVSRYPIESCLPLPAPPPSITKASALSSCSMTPSTFPTGNHTGSGVQLPPPIQMLQQQQQRVSPAPCSSSSGSSSSSGMLSSPSGSLQQQQQQQQPDHFQGAPPQLPPSPLSGYRYSGSIGRPLFTNNDENDFLYSKGSPFEQQQAQQVHNRTSRAGDYFSYPSSNHHQLPPPIPSYYVTPGGQATGKPVMSPFDSPGGTSDIFQTPRRKEHMASFGVSGAAGFSTPINLVSPTHLSSSSANKQHSNNNNNEHHHHGSWQRPITNI